MKNRSPRAAAGSPRRRLLTTSYTLLAALPLLLGAGGPLPTKAPKPPKVLVVPRPQAQRRAYPRTPFTLRTKKQPPASKGPNTHRASTKRKPQLVPCAASEATAAGAFRPPLGETLSYDLEVMGVRAGKLRLRYLPDAGGGTKIVTDTRTNTFFENVRKMRATAVSFLAPGGLRPTRYREDAVEDGVTKWAELRYRADRHEASLDYAIAKRSRHRVYPQTTGPNDLLSVVYFLRSLTLQKGQRFCLDVYGNRHMYRVRGSVVGEEWVSTPGGKVKTWRLSGKAQRVDHPTHFKTLHFWISQDAQHLPVAVLGEIDLGPVSATLSKLPPQAVPKGKAQVFDKPW